ncbi:MAG: pantetheine-phosphate adenylyltransferase [Blastocatellia bacterium]|nr:pantetheine-phosphate adenylyltransferase [Blastocatellia bacterium]
MHRAIYPGSFDPLTNGHLDVIERAHKMFDELIIAVLVNIDKNPLFDLKERLEIIREVCSKWPRIHVDTFDGLLVHYAINKQADCIIRGIRAISDYEYELQMALMNRKLAPQIETVFLMAAESYSYLSSRLVKEVCKLGGSVDGLVPEIVEQRLREKMR